MEGTDESDAAVVSAVDGGDAAVAPDGRVTVAAAADE